LRRLGPKRLVAYAIGALAAFALSAGATPAVGSTPNVLQFNYDEDDLQTLNPFLATAAPNGPLSELTSGEFVRFDARGNPIPELVTAIPTKANHGISADARTITWHLRHGVKWSDGAPFDADDVTYTFRVATDRDNNIPVRAPWERLAAVTAPDRYTVVFHFKAPYALFLSDYFSTESPTCVLPKHILGPGTKINQAPFNGLPVGLGAFRYTAFNRGNDVELEANPYYWRGHAKLQRIIYKMITEENTDYTELQTGELDLWALINGALAQRVRTLPGISVATAPGGIMSGVYFNTQRPAVRDPRVRRALRFATDQATMVNKIALGNGLAQRSLIASVAEDYLALPAVAYDPKRAAALLDAAGWRRGPDGVRQKKGVPLIIEVAIPGGYAPSANAANILHADWGAIGVIVNIHVWADSQFFAPASAGGIIQSGRFDAALFSNGGAALYATLSSYYTCADFPPNGFNVVRYCNPRVDALNTRYAQTFDPAQRKAIAAEFQRLLDADVPGIVFYQRIYVSAYTNRLRGYHPSTFSSWGDPLELEM
jgi:peptide/nickel transport system substrate-binding protein